MRKPEGRSKGVGGDSDREEENDSTEEREEMTENGWCTHIPAILNAGQVAIHSCQFDAPFEKGYSYR